MTARWRIILFELGTLAFILVMIGVTAFGLQLAGELRRRRGCGSTSASGR